MAAAAQERIAPDFTLRPATPDDFAFIHALRMAGLREHVGRVWGWDAAAQLARCRDRFDHARYQVIVHAGRDVGAVSVEWREDEARLADIEILEEWRGQGLGTVVLRALIAEADRLNVPIALQVLKGNPARRLYEWLGFRVETETTTHHLMRRAHARETCSRSDSPTADGR